MVRENTPKISQTARWPHDPTIADMLPGINPRPHSPPGALGVAPVRLLAAGEGRFPTQPNQQPMLVLRLMASDNSTGQPVRLDLAFPWEDAIRLQGATSLLLDTAPPCACHRRTSGSKGEFPTGDPGTAMPPNANSGDL